MIDFALPEEVELLRATARSFAVDQLGPGLRRFESARAVSNEVVERFVQTGLAAVDWPEVLGGASLGALARAVVLEELAAVDPGAALGLDPIGPALHPLRAHASEGELRELLAPLVGAPGSRAVLVGRPPAELHLAGGRVRGTVPWVPSERVDLLVVLGPAEVWAIDAGIRCRPVRGSGLRAAGASEIELEDAPLRARFAGAGACRGALARARLDVAALLVGVMRGAADYSRAYALERVAFGRPIAHHQALAFLIADMATAVDAARLLLLEAAWRVDAGEDAVGAAAAALVEATEQALFVTPNAVQILGGHGFMLDHPVEKAMREARALSLLLGGVDAAREDAGRELLLCERRAGRAEVTA